MQLDKASGRWELHFIDRTEGVRVKPDNLEPVVEDVRGLSVSCGSEHTVVLAARLPITDETRRRYEDETGRRLPGRRRELPETETEI